MYTKLIFCDKLITTNLDYTFNKTINDITFENAVLRTTDELKKEGFGVITEINVKETFKKKLDVNFRNYIILGACNPGFAYKAIHAESRIGAFLPCNVIVQENENGEIEISVVDPNASMSSVENENLAEIASEVRGKLMKVIDQI